MDAINYNDCNNNAFCYISKSSLDLQRYLHYIFRNNYTIVSVVPINHLTYDESPYFYVCYSTSDSDDDVCATLFFWDLMDLIKRDDITLIRVIHYSRN